MLLLIIRHADAGERDPAKWSDDSQRPLSDKGRKTHRRVSRALGRLELVPELVLTSPWTRAAETADILAEELKLDRPPVPVAALADTPDLSRLADDLGRPASGAVVAMVGHSPWMEELGAILLGGSATSVRIDFPKSGVLGIDLAELAPGAGELRFLLRPKQLG
jgi:phosphohistidine phosphatase